MATGKRQVTLGILGTAAIPPNLVIDVLNDHLSMGAEDAEGYFGASDKYDLALIVPASAEATGEGVHAVWEWAIRCELPYTVCWDDTGNGFTDAILGNVEDAESDIDLVDDVYTAMVERLAKATNPLLLVLSTDGQLDAATAEAAATALREGLPVHDLSRALLEISWQHLPDHEPPEEPAIEVEADGQMALTVVSDAPDVTLSAGEAAAVNQALTDAETFLDCLSDLLAGTDRLRQSLVRGRSLLAPKPDVPVDAEAGEQPKKTRLEIFNERTGQWEPAGRGRPPKGAQKRRVPVA